MTHRILLPNSTTLFIEQQCDFVQWQRAVNFHKHLLEQNKAKSWLLYCENSYQFSVLFFALLTADKKIILPQNGTVNQLAQSMIYADGFAGGIGQDEVFQTQSITDNIFRYHANEFLELSAPLSINLANEIVLYTSGSSGKAKSVNKCFSHLLAEIETLERYFGASLKASCILSTVSHQHIYGLLFKLLWPIWFSHDVIMQAYQYPEHLCHDVEKFSLENVVLVSSPAHLHRLVKDNIYQEKGIQFTCLFSSGGPLSQNASQLLKQQLNQTVVEVFGSTETGGIAWRENANDISSSWQVFDNIKIQQSPIDECLQIKSPYFEHQDWYNTEDRIKLHAEGRFDLLGRIDRIVKIEEKRVSLDHVQHCLKNLPFVEDAYCFDWQSKRGLQVVALIVLTAKAKAALKQSKNLVFNRKITHALSNDLEAIALPKKFRYLAALPYNPSGKLSRIEMERFFE